jgi:hypothetical protein
MTPVAVFLWGFAGSVAIEIASFANYFPIRSNYLPARYYSRGFWITRFLLAVVAGGLAVAYEIQKPLLAINVGASVPLLLNTLARGLQPSKVW